MAENAGMRRAKPLTFAGLTTLAQALDSKQARTSFGKLPLSIERSQPIYAVPHGTRDAGNKLYMGADLAKSNAGKVSPGPGY